MINSVNSNYKAICELFDFKKDSDSIDDTKKLLLKMAKKGESKPDVRTKLGHKFYRYAIDKKHDCYDSKFAESISKANPNWLKSRQDRSSDRKQKIIQWAKNKKLRISDLDSLLRCNLYFYLKSDKNFAQKIYKLRPDMSYFLKVKGKVKRPRTFAVKNKIINLAKSKSPRPKGPLNNALKRYLTKCNSSYDPKFEKTIRELDAELNLRWFRK